MEKECLLGDDIFVIRDFLTAEECDTFIRMSEDNGYEEATITTAAGFVMNKNVRNNDRVILDSVELAQDLWPRARQWLPEIRGWNAVGLNERFRFYRYDRGQKFALHSDGYFRRNNLERSHLTFMIYLNDDFEGGETTFFIRNRTAIPTMSVRPERSGPEIPTISVRPAPLARSAWGVQRIQYGSGVHALSASRRHRSASRPEVRSADGCHV